jgi:hypothetical protein
MKCKYWKICELYDKDNLVCNKYRGFYYDMDSPAGCYRTMMEKEESIKEKKLERKLRK